MRFTTSAKHALVCAAALLAACTNATTPTNTTTNTAANRAANTATGAVATPTTAASDIPFPEIKRITTDETNALVAKNEAVIVDTRGDSAYNDGHIKGALNITSSDLAARIKELPRDKKIVTYCS